MPLVEAIVKYPKKSSCSSLIMRSKTNPTSPSTMKNSFNLLRSDSSCEKQARTPVRPPSNYCPDINTDFPADNSTPSQKGPAVVNSQTFIRRNCSYTTCRSFPYYIPVPSTAKLNAKPKKFQSFMTSVEQEQSVLSPSGSEGSSRDSGFNSHTSSPVPPVVSSDIDQFLDEIANLDDIN